MTTFPLICFTTAARRLPYSTIGLLQYIAPTTMFLLAVLCYGEPFSLISLITFCFIWTGLALFAADKRK